MEREVMYNAAYNGSKKFSQHDVPHANATGFAAAADDYMERGIDLNEQLILNKPATFFFRMNGEAMINAGIQKSWGVVTCVIHIFERSLLAGNTNNNLSKQKKKDNDYRILY